MAGRDDEEQRVRAERARAIGLFRYQLIREAADPAHSTKARGRLVREIAAREHVDPFGRRVRVSRQSLDRWIRDWRAGGFDALVPAPRQVTARTPAEVLELAVALRRENPRRTAAAIRRILRAQLGWAPDERTLQRNFTRLGLTGAARADGPVPAVFGRFEANHPNELWIGDALHGMPVGGRKAYLFAFVDDHSRAMVGHRWGYAEDAVRLAAALRPALGSRGVPQGIYVDNGSAFVDSGLLRACAKLGIKLIHSTPGRPQGRGKIERLFRTVRDQFLVEITGDPDPERHVGRHYVADLTELNRLFTAWVEIDYHRAVHSETGQTPITRWQTGAPFALPTPAALREAFLWEQQRTVAKTATVSLHGNTYQVDPALVGRKVELVFDPFDLTHIEVRLHSKPMGMAIPHHIGRHAHPKARPETPPPPPAPPSGIDYAALIDTAHQAQLAQGVNYAALADSNPQPDPPDQIPGEIPGQLDLLTGDEVA
jgi:putative transposase